MSLGQPRHLIVFLVIVAGIFHLLITFSAAISCCFFFAFWHSAMHKKQKFPAVTQFLGDNLPINTHYIGLIEGFPIGVRWDRGTSHYPLTVPKGLDFHGMDSSGMDCQLIDFSPVEAFWPEVRKKPDRFDAI